MPNQSVHRKWQADATGFSLVSDRHFADLYAVSLFLQVFLEQLQFRQKIVQARYG